MLSLMLATGCDAVPFLAAMLLRLAPSIQEVFIDLLATLQEESAVRPGPDLDAQK